MNGLLIAAPSSGAGKTTLTLGILRALAQDGVSVTSAKSGPDFIDPQFHRAATGHDCENLDAWAMEPARLQTLAGAGADLLVVEGAMGLFDGAPPDGQGSSADLAEALGLPVLLVVDCARMSHSVSALVSGFTQHRATLQVAGLILNNTGSERHETMLRRALSPLRIPILGAVRRMSALQHPSRHLGLEQAEERQDLAQFLDQAADLVRAALDLTALQALAQPVQTGPASPQHFTPLGQHIAIAKDTAFSFIYPHLMRDWRDAGAELSFFSPLADQAPNPAADAIYLPGGYPELHAGRIAGAATFLSGLRQSSAQIYGECGGYMVLGQGLEDGSGNRHAMAGLLELETSFATPKRHLGYRQLQPLGGPFKGTFKAHEFHYSTALAQAGEPLFEAWDAEGNTLGKAGLRVGRVCGSYMHLIAPNPA